MVSGDYEYPSTDEILRMSRDELAIHHARLELADLDTDIRIEERFGRRPPARWLDRREILLAYLADK